MFQAKQPGELNRFKPLLDEHMDFFRKHDKFWKVIIAVSSIALVASSLIPLLSIR